MTVAVDLEFDGGTLEQYDEVAKLMDYEPGGAAPRGVRPRRAACFTGARSRTVVCASRMSGRPKQFEQYAQEKIGLYSHQVGIPGPPQITFYDVHNYQAASVPT